MLPKVQVIFLSLLSFCNGVNILGIYYHAGKSHHILGEMLLKQLARKGHNVTMVSPFPLKEPFPNYTDIHLTGLVEDQLAREEIFMKMNKGDPLLSARLTVELTRAQLELTLNHTAMKELVKSGTKFDVIIMDLFMNGALMIYGKIFEAPIVAVASHGTTFIANAVVGNPAPPSYLPNTLFSFPNSMTFIQRALNGIVTLLYNVIAEDNYRYQENLLKKYFDNPPTIYELFENVSVVLSNGHYSFESPRPFVPNLIPVGGFHVQQPTKLPHDLKEFMDGAEAGVIYFSLGSNMKSVLLPTEKQEQILKAFSKLPYKVLWKWESDELPIEKSNNVLIRKWFPQNDILAHPKLKLFISHGGLLSTIEALYFGVPVLGIPIFGDQKNNIPNAVAAGYAVQLELSDLDENTLSRALDEILNNPKYAENAKKRSALLHDQPLSPMDTAVFWVEHVIRYKGAPHLRNGGIYLSWYQYLMLDVAALVIGVLTAIIASIYYFIRKTINFVRRRLFQKEKTE